MKHLIGITIFIFSTIIISAQVPTNSAAKIYYKGVQKHFETLKNCDPQSQLKFYLSEVDKAEEKIKLIRKSQPDYDVSALNKELQGYKNTGSQSTNAQNNTGKDASDLGKETEKIFKAPSLNDFNSGLTMAQTALQDYKKLVSDFVSSNAKQRIENAKKAGYYSHSQGLRSEIIGFDARATEIKNDYNKSDTENGAIAYYYLANKYMIYWETAKNCMPEEKLFSDNYNLAAGVFKEMGTVDDAKGLAKKNEKVRAAKVKIPVAVRKDAAMENLFRQTFMAQGWNETVMLINLRDNDWGIIKNEYTGAILGRAQTAAIAAKNMNGDCSLYVFTIMQDYTGSAYQTNTHRRGHDVALMACENVK